jgi:hypothetical protein
MSLHEYEVENAVLHIAHQIAIRENCVVDEGIITMFGNNYNHIVSDSNFKYNDSNIEEIKNRIEVIDTHIYPQLVVVIGKDTQNATGTNPPIPRNGEERPIWVRNPQWVRDLPGFEDYYVGVGISERYSLFYRGIIVADVRAAQAIASEKGIYIRTYLHSKIDTYTTNTDSGVISLTQTELEGFYILDRWIEPDFSMCYSLGIARKF